jgi:hypothetical protein
MPSAVIDMAEDEKTSRMDSILVRLDMNDP